MRVRSCSVRAALSFTLVEVLVAVALFSLIMVFMTGLTNHATLLSQESNKHMDADDQARLALDRMAADLAAMPKRTDIDYLFAKQGGNDACFFYSAAPATPAATAASSFLSLVGYRVNASANTQGGAAYRLERLSKWLDLDPNAGQSPVYLSYANREAFNSDGTTNAPVAASTFTGSWYGAGGGLPSVTGTGGVFSSFVGTAANNYQDGQDAGWQTLAPGVIRMEICFLDNTGKLTTEPDGVLETHTLSHISAFVVTLAVIDDASRRLLSPAQVAAIAAALPDPSNPSPAQFPEAMWKSALQSGSFAQNIHVPAMAAAQIRVYQRIFFLN